MNFNINDLFMFLLILGILLFFISFFLRHNNSCPQKGCFINEICLKGKLKRWSIFLIIIAIIWILVKAFNDDLMETFANWTIYMSLLVSLLTCIILYNEVIDHVEKGKKDFFVYIPIIYFILFIILLIVELKKYDVMNFFGLSFSQYKILYSWFYLWAYVLMMYLYISQLKNQNNSNFEKELEDLKSIVNRIDLPVAFSFTFFAIVFFIFCIHPGDLVQTDHHVLLKKSAIFGIGGASLHILTSTFLFLYEYSEKYFKIKFPKVN